MKKNKYPFIIHVHSLKTNEAIFPTHTHGLTEIGWPEFMMDPFSFGPYGTGDRIKSAYHYLKQPKNRKKLEAILKGEIVELSIKTLNPNWGDLAPNYTLCFRKVSNDFEGVKLAYDTGDGVDPDLVIVQIWVRGDDFALMDEYYRGGIKW